MRLSDVLERPVVDGDGRSWGAVHDVRLVQDGPVLASGLAALRVHGLVVGPASIATRLGYTARPGYETQTRGPLPIKLLIRWLQRKAVYIPWPAVEAVEADRVLVRAPPEGFRPARE